MALGVVLATPMSAANPLDLSKPIAPNFVALRSRNTIGYRLSQLGVAVEYLFLYGK